MEKELDRLFQEYSKGKRCKYCKRPAECIHHIIEKSRSFLLRWDLQNAMPVCIRCHNLIHTGKIKTEKNTYLKNNENKSLKEYLLNKGITKKEYMQNKKKELRDATTYYTAKN